MIIIITTINILLINDDDDDVMTNMMMMMMMMMMMTRQKLNDSLNYGNVLNLAQVSHPWQRNVGGQGRIQGGRGDLQVLGHF